jgi:hypothetical protein
MAHRCRPGRRHPAVDGCMGADARFLLFAGIVLAPGAARGTADGGQVLACGPAGSLLIFHGSAWHGYTANTSARPPLAPGSVHPAGRAGRDGGPPRSRSDMGWSLIDNLTFREEAEMVGSFGSPAPSFGSPILRRASRTRSVGLRAASESFAPVRRLRRTDLADTAAGDDPSGPTGADRREPVLLPFGLTLEDLPRGIS